MSLHHRLRMGSRLSALAYRANVTASANNLVVPSDVTEADLLVFINYRSATIGPVNAVTPSGYTNALSLADGGTNYRTMLSYKRATTADQGQTVTGMSSGSGTTVNQSILLVLRADSLILGASSGSVIGGYTSGDPADGTITSASGAAPLAAIGIYRQDAATGQAMSPTADATVNVSTLTARVKTYNSSPSDVTIGEGDGGNFNFLGGLYLGVS